MEPVQITPKASSDIAKLAQGVNRAEVALEALKESELTPKQVQQLEALLKKVSTPSATTSPAVSETKPVDGHQAVVGKITVNGQQLDTLLSEGSVAEVDCRMATASPVSGHSGVPEIDPSGLSAVLGLLAAGLGLLERRRYGR